MSRIHLSVPHLGEREVRHVGRAFASNWISSVGPQLEEFERAFAARLGRPAIAVASGTAAIHLGLRALGVGPGDEVLVSDLTFVASVNPIRYLGATPAFVDSERASWNMDPALLAEALEDRARRGRLPRAVVVVHLYGQCADMDPILAACRRYGVPVLEDAAEALGAAYRGAAGGHLRRRRGVFSFNGNKIITTSGGGMLVASDERVAPRAASWPPRRASRASTTSTPSSATTTGSQQRPRRRSGAGSWRSSTTGWRSAAPCSSATATALADLPGLELDARGPLRRRHPLAHRASSSTPRRFGADRDDLLPALAAADIDSRPVWKPMHLQPLYAGCETAGGDVAAWLYSRGICLPSSSSLSAGDQDRVLEVIRGVARAGKKVRPRFRQPRTEPEPQLEREEHSR